MVLIQLSIALLSPDPWTYCALSKPSKIVQYLLLSDQPKSCSERTMLWCRENVEKKSNFQTQSVWHCLPPFPFKVLQLKPCSFILKHVSGMYLKPTYATSTLLCADRYTLFPVQTHFLFKISMLVYTAIVQSSSE